ncbi:MAG: GNAT family N-acetyltransferase [Dechloromonas sp.]|nr:GNAT family N-acetyltransferase [Dechloromonas sp.]
MQIREAKSGDGEAIASLLTALDYPDTEGFIDSKIEQLLKHPDGRLLVAVEGSEILGFISLHFIPQLALPGDFCRISYFCVDEASRGRGVGAGLEEAAVELAKERGCDRIEVHCHARRELAHRFYHRQGYAESPKYLLKLLK